MMETVEKNEELKENPLFGTLDFLSGASNMSVIHSVLDKYFGKYVGTFIVKKECGCPSRNYKKSCGIS